MLCRLFDSGLIMIFLVLRILLMMMLILCLFVLRMIIKLVFLLVFLLLFRCSMFWRLMIGIKWLCRCMMFVLFSFLIVCLDFMLMWISLCIVSCGMVKCCFWYLMISVEMIVNVSGILMVKWELWLVVDDMLIMLLICLIFVCIIFMLILWLDRLVILVVVEKFGVKIKWWIWVLVRCVSFLCVVRFFFRVFLLMCLVFSFLLLFVMVMMMCLFLW